MEGNLTRGVEAAAAIDVVAAGGRRRGLALTRRVGTTFVLVSSAAWSVGYAVLAVDRYRQYGAARFDLGNMVQAVWNTGRGRFLEMTLETGDQASRLGVHVDPILALFAPATWIFPTPEVLIVGQAIVLGAGAWPVLELSRRRLESEVAAVFLALAYLASPWIAWETQTDFHPVALAISFFLFAIWFLDGGRYVAFAGATALALLCGELMGLPLVGLGVWHAASTRRWRAGALIAAAGVAWTAACLRIVIPAFGEDHSPFYRHFQEVGGSPSGLVRTIVTDPAAIASSLFTSADIIYVILLALPLLGLFVAAPLLALAAAPQLLVNMLSESAFTTSVRHHYVAGVIPFLIAATVVGLSRFGLRRRVMLASLVFETSLVLSIAFGPWPSLAVPAEPYPYRAHRAEANRDAALAAIALVPPGAAVASTNAAGAHLSERRYFYSVPLVGRAKWVLVDRRDAWIARDTDGRTVYGPLPGRVAAFERDLRGNPRWQVVFERGDVTLFRRVDAAATLGSRVADQ